MVSTRRGAARIEDSPVQRGRRVGLRGIGLGLVCVVALSIVTVYSDLVWRGTTIALNALPMGAFSIFCLLVALLNTTLYRVRPNLAFTRDELLTAYVMMLLAASLPSLGLTIPLLNIIPSATYFGQLQPEWEAFLPYVPPWVTATDPAAVIGFYEGLPSGQAIPWGSWLRPLAAWTTFAFLWFFAYFCLAVAVRRQWGDRERLAFPLAEVPLAVAGSQDRPTLGNPLFRNWLLWVGFALPWVVHSLNGLHSYFPNTPAMRLTGIPVAQGLTTPPWSALRGIAVSWYFSIAGLTFLIPVRVSSSSLVFWALRMLAAVGFAAAGITASGNSDPTYFTITWFYAHQQLGAILAIAGISAWSMRGLLIRRPAADDGLSGPAGLSTEQWAVLGFVISFVLIGLWGIAAGASFLWQIVFVGIYTASAFALVRLVAAGGFMWVDVDFSPIDPMLQVFSTGAFTPRDLTVFSYEGIFCWWNVGWANIMQFATQGLRIATVGRMDLRRTAVAMGLACVVSAGVGYWLSITLAYRGLIPRETGYLTAGLPSFHLDKLVTILQRPVPTQWSALAGLGMGFAVMMGLEGASRRWFWFALSPLGYLVGLSWVMDVMWFPIVIGGAANSLVSRYFGLHGYRKLRPFFLGMILGEFLTAAQWLAIDAIAGVKGHSILP